MKKILVAIYLSLIMLSALSALRTEDVLYRINVEYNPSGNCTVTCSNSTSGNTTFQTCNNLCNGVIKIQSGESTNHITVVEEVNNLITPKQYTGYKTAEIGNDTDITGITGILNQYANNCTISLNKCMDSNRNISSQLDFCTKDSKFEKNFTECLIERNKFEESMNAKSSELTTATEELKDERSNKFLFGIGGIILGFVVYNLYKKYNSPKDQTESFAGNVPY